MMVSFVGPVEEPERGEPWPPAPLLFDFSRCALRSCTLTGNGRCASSHHETESPRHSTVCKISC
jgi:hypothetical protein